VPPFLEPARAAAAKAGCDDLLVLGEGEGAMPFGALLQHGDEPPASAIDPDATAALMYSSGTTGAPKGVELSHRALVTNIVQCEAVLDIGDDDMVLYLSAAVRGLRRGAARGRAPGGVRRAARVSREAGLRHDRVHRRDRHLHDGRA
jgi:AMP-binding enzyme